MCYFRPVQKLSQLDVCCLSRLFLLHLLLADQPVLTVKNELITSLDILTANPHSQPASYIYSYLASIS